MSRNKDKNIYFENYAKALDLSQSVVKAASKFKKTISIKKSVMNSRKYGPIFIPRLLRIRKLSIKSR